MIIATKGGYLHLSLAGIGKTFVPIIGTLRKLMRPFKNGLKKKSGNRKNFKIEYLRRALENSLKRLETDYIDLYQLHSPPEETLRSDEVFEALEKWKQQGKIRYYGVSVKKTNDGLICLRNSNIASLQLPFNLLEAKAARIIFPKVSERNFGIIARMPLARGLLTPDRKVKTGLKLSDEYGGRNPQDRIQSLSFLIANHQRTLPQASIQFILQQPQVTTTIVGTLSKSHLKENIETLKLEKLKESEIQKIFSISNN